MALVVLSPIFDLKLSVSSKDLNTFSRSADQIVSSATDEAKAAQIQVIKDKTQAYVCDKAAALGCKLDVAVTVSSDAPFQPLEITLEGDTSPYCRKILSDTIAAELNIPPEDQTWINQK